MLALSAGMKTLVWTQRMGAAAYGHAFPALASPRAVPSAASAQVPVSAAMAVQLAAEARAEEDERAEIKRLVLRANADLDLAGASALPTQQAPPPAPAKTGARVLWWRGTW